MEFLFVRFVFLFSFLFRLNFCAVNFASFPQRGKRSRPYRFILLSMDCLEKYISCTTGREKDFRTKWSAFSSLLNTV